MKKAIVLVAVIGSLVLAFTLVWMNRYAYQSVGQSWKTVRLNRFTGQVCYSQEDGTWNSNLTAPPKWLDAYMRDPAKWSAQAKDDPFAAYGGQAAPAQPTPPPGFVLDKPAPSDPFKEFRDPAQPSIFDSVFDEKLAHKAKVEAQKYSLNTCR